jgi:glycosyltransferase involved in cell wall biosynthesis
MTKILIISGDLVDSNMGGVGVRYWELAHALAPQCQVTLAVPDKTDLTSDQVTLVPFDLMKGDIRSLAEQADVLVTHGFIVHHHPYLKDLDIPMAVDLYVPHLLESLVWHAHDDLDSWIPAYQEYLRIQLELLRYGDYFFCASEKQRDYWLGWLHAQKRINPHTYLDDPTLRNLIDVVPFGLQEGLPVQKRATLKGVHPGIGVNDNLILWAGGVWDWLDPLTPIRAMGLLASQHPDLKLYFLGTHHPNPVVANMAMVDKAIALSQELGLYNRSVFFGDWVPYTERENYLAEADLSVVAHPGHIETRFSFRTRGLDCIWAGLPMIVTDGDTIAEWVLENDLGVIVPPEDESAMAAAIEQVLNNGGRSAYAQAFVPVRERLRWGNVIAPLLQFCLHPRKAPDKGLYLTELERISRDKDAFINKVIQDKDAYIEQVIHDKDAYIEQIIRDKDAYLEAVVKDRDSRLETIGQDWQQHMDRVIQDKVQMYENMLHERDLALEQARRERDENIRELQRIRSKRLYRLYQFFRRALKG